MSATARKSTPQTLDDSLAAASAAAAPLAALDLVTRSRALRQVAAALDASSDQLVTIAAEETSLPAERLAGEVARTTGQLRMFADGVLEGSWLDAVIDTADPQAAPVPRPDLRRMQLAVGPVLVFAAGNFPFAFSVAGGDTAAALAAGCPVVVKAHPGHPETSRRVAALVSAELAGAGLPSGSFALIEGQETGVAALRDQRVRAASFTGSLSAGRALSDVAAVRENPIPFYAEMGSLNPAFVSPGAVRARGEAIVAGFVASFTLGVGQLCTKPGLLFVPRGHDLTERLIAAAGAVPAAPMLLDRIRLAHGQVRESIAARPGVRELLAVLDQSGMTGPTLLGTDVDTLLAESDALLTECFGPTSIVVEYDGTEQALAAARRLEGTLAATVHAEPDEADFTRPLLAELEARSGRVVYNGWPTGVTVSWAMHHGGPYPATSWPAYTSVGMTAIRRFLRPVCYQDLPQELLPPVLRNDNPARIPRRIDGQLTTDDVAGATPAQP